MWLRVVRRCRKWGAALVGRLKGMVGDGLNGCVWLDSDDLRVCVVRGGRRWGAVRVALLGD